MDSFGVVTRVAKKKIKVSKNKKKNWRKHSNIKDVEEFLEDQRLQLRTGGIIAEKPDESLFFEDKKQVPEVKGRKKKGLRPIYPNLEPDDTIKPVPKGIPYNPNKATGNKKLKNKVRNLSELEKLGIFTPGRLDKLQESLSQSARHTEEKKKEKASRESGRAEYDLWGDAADPVSKAYGKKRVHEGASEHYLRVTKKVPKKLPHWYLEKPTKVPAVEVEAPGASYNPSFEDHQKLILATAEVEAAKEKKEDKLIRWHSKIKKLSAKELEKAHMQEMSAGIFSTQADDESAEAKDGEEEFSLNPPVVADARKTRKSRRKEKEEKIKAQKLQTDKTDRIRMNEVYRLRGIKRELNEGEEESEERKKARMEKKAAEEGMPKQVGKHPVEEPDLAIKLSDELTGTLRELKPEGDLLIERYKHFQKRNLIEARAAVRNYKRKTKTKKEYTRKSHKDELQTLPFRSQKRNLRKLLK